MAQWSSAWHAREEWVVGSNPATINISAIDLIHPHTEIDLRGYTSPRNQTTAPLGLRKPREALDFSAPTNSRPAAGRDHPATHPIKHLVG